MLKLHYTQKKGDRIVASFEAYALNMAWESDDVLAFIEIAGPTTATRAMWAHLLKRRVGSSSDRPDPTSITFGVEKDTLKLEAKVRYLSHQIGENYVVMKKGFSKDLRHFFIGGDMKIPSPYFLSAFRLNFTTIPILPEWTTGIWQLALEKELIEPFHSYSVNNTYFWKFKSGSNEHYSERIINDWKNIVKEVALGPISGS